MKSVFYVGGLIASWLSIAIVMPPAIAGVTVNVPSNIGALFHTESDFFEEGREQFEVEIERLLQPELETLVLTIEDAVPRDHSVPGLEQLPPLPPSATPKPSQ